VQSEYTNLGGVAPIVMYLADRHEIVSVAGIGTWPSAISIEWFRSHGYTEVPLGGITTSIVPSAADAWLTTLARYGTLRLADVAAAAIELAEDGFPVHQFLHDNLHIYAHEMGQWPSTTRVYRPGGEIPNVGDLLVQKDLASTLRRLVEAEDGARSSGRAEAILAARERFYRGDIARTMAEFCHDQGGLLTVEDLANYAVEIAPPPSVTYRGYEVFACDTWCQGPVVLQALRILERFDVKALGQNSVDALHLIAEALKLAFADRQRFYGDPRQVEVPLGRLLSPEYAAARAELVDSRKAWDHMPPSGADAELDGVSAGTLVGATAERKVGPDTSYVSVVDRHGNAFSATPSDGAATTPVVPGLGLVISDRGRQCWLDPENPTAVSPRMRPRLTPSPGLVRQGDGFVMPYGTPGGEIQPQAMLQFLVNFVDFGMDAQEAIEAPRLATFSHPESGTPHTFTPGLIKGESRLGDTLDQLADRGHTVQPWPPYTPLAGAVCAIAADRARGLSTAAADVRRMSYAMGW
jgi:gamma-glutamyltranspeptidase/glutathione hydrolase